MLFTKPQRQKCFYSLASCSTFILKSQKKRKQNSLNDQILRHQFYTQQWKVKETGVVEKGTSRLAQLQWAHEKWWSIFPVHYDWTLLFKCHIFNSFYGWIDYCIDVRLEKHHLVSCICHKPIRFNHESLTILVGLVTFPFWKTAPVLYQ